MWQDGQVVWAKLKWYPWWPAKVETIDGNSDKVRVIFFEDNTYRDMSNDSLVDFTNGMKYKKTKRKDLLKAITEAEEYLRKADVQSDCLYGQNEILDSHVSLRSRSQSKKSRK